MKRPEIQTVCSHGCGSSFMLRMNVGTIVEQHNIKTKVFRGDVATYYTNDCDVIFISRGLTQHIKGRARVPIVVFNNFMNKQRVEEKTLTYFKTLKQLNRRML